jgi:hypothetical protein
MPLQFANLLMLQVHAVQQIGKQRPQLRVEDRFLFLEMDCGKVLKLAYGRLNFGDELGSEAQGGRVPSGGTCSVLPSPKFGFAVNDLYAMVRTISGIASMFR